MLWCLRADPWDRTRRTWPVFLGLWRRDSRAEPAATVAAGPSLSLFLGRCWPAPGNIGLSLLVHQLVIQVGFLHLGRALGYVPAVRALFSLVVVLAKTDILPTRLHPQIQ